MVERVKLSQDTPSRSTDGARPSIPPKPGSVRAKNGTGRPLGPHARARRVKKKKKPGTFDTDNQPKQRGRPKGSENKTTRILKEAILLAAELTGENLRGRRGLVGYLCRQARREPVAFMALLKSVMPLQVLGEIEHTHEHQHRHYHSIADVRAALRERGITVDEIYEKPMKVIEHRKDELKVEKKEMTAVQKAMIGGR